MQVAELWKKVRKRSGNSTNGKFKRGETNEIAREGWMRRRCSEDRELVRKMRTSENRWRSGERGRNRET